MFFGDWRDKLRPASFRRVPFSVQSDDAEFGRTTVRHDFPQREEPYIEDMGKAAREFSIDAIMIGDDYASKRDAIVKACETKGAGTLVHPYYGTITVTNLACKVRHSSSDGRMCVIALSFIKAGKVVLPKVGNDNFTRTIASAGAAVDAAVNKFTNRWNVFGVANYVYEHAQAVVGSVASGVSALKSQARKVAGFTTMVGNLTAQGNNLLLAPADLAHSVLDCFSFDFGAGTLTNPYNMEAKIEDFREVHQLFTYGDDQVLPVGTSPSTLAMIENQLAMSEYVQCLAVGLAARIIPDLTFTSYEDAMMVQALVLDKASSIAEASNDTAIYQAMQNLRSEVVHNIEVKAVGLSRIQTYVPPQTVSSLRLAFDLYGAIDLESDIVARNKVRNPCLIPGGVPLEVLSNG
jgi:prophage DNA circulation protein